MIKKQVECLAVYRDVKGGCPAILLVNRNGVKERVRTSKVEKFFFRTAGQLDIKIETKNTVYVGYNIEIIND